MKKSLLILINAICIFFVYGCQTQKSPVSLPVKTAEPAEGDNFIRGIIAEPDVLNPLISRGTPSKNVEDYIFNSLINYDENFDPVCELAESYTESTNETIWYFHLKPDAQKNAEKIALLLGKLDEAHNTRKITGFYSDTTEIIRVDFSQKQSSETLKKQLPDSIKTAFSHIFSQYIISFTLHRNIKWHDSHPFTAQDVLFTYEKIIDPSIKSIFWRDPFLCIDSVSCPDNYTVNVCYNAPHFMALDCWRQQIIPRHILQNADIERSSFNYAPIGTGPYILQEWRRKESITLKSNPDYFMGKPYISTVIFRNFPDKSVLFEELQSGRIDYMALNTDQYLKISKNEELKKHFQLYSYPSQNSYSYMGYNLDSLIFSSTSVRLALAHAVNVDKLIEEILCGFGQRVTGPFSPYSPAYNQQIPEFVFDRIKAEEILRNDGWMDSDNNGILDKNGTELSFSILINAGDTVRRLTAEHIINDLSACKIKASIETVEWVHYLDRLKKRNFQAYLGTRVMKSATDLSWMWHTDTIPSSANNFYGLNYVGYSNPSVDKMIDDSLFTVSVKKRNTLFHKCHAVISSEQPYLFLYTKNATVVISSRFKGIAPVKTGFFHDFIKWYVPVSVQKYK